MDASSAAEEAGKIVCEWVLQPSRAAERAWLERHAATLLTHYAVALLLALSTHAEDVALRQACDWRRKVALRARVVGIAAGVGRGAGRGLRTGDPRSGG